MGAREWWWAGYRIILWFVLFATSLGVGAGRLLGLSQKEQDAASKGGVGTYTDFGWFYGYLWVSFAVRTFSLLIKTNHLVEDHGQAVLSTARSRLVFDKWDSTVHVAAVITGFILALVVGILTITSEATAFSVFLGISLILLFDIPLTAASLLLRMHLFVVSLRALGVALDDVISDEMLPETGSQVDLVLAYRNALGVAVSKHVLTWQWGWLGIFFTVWSSVGYLALTTVCSGWNATKVILITVMVALGAVWTFIPTRLSVWSSVLAQKSLHLSHPRAALMFDTHSADPPSFWRLFGLVPLRLSLLGIMAVYVVLVAAVVVALNL